MKKSIFIIAALCAATFVSAQITLEKTFEWDLNLGSSVQVLQGSSIHSNYIVDIDYTPMSLGSYIVEINRKDYYYPFFNVYDFKTFTLLKTFNVNDMVPQNSYDLPFLISRSIFTTDDRWAWAYFSESTDDSYELFIVTEDHAELLHVSQIPGPCNNRLCIIKVYEQYKLVVIVKAGDSSYETQIYSLPGNGDSGQDISTPVAPRNSRKVLKKDQVLVENADRTYTLQGQEVK